MKKTLLLVAVLFTAFTSFATQHTITTEGNTYSPNQLNATVGDTVHFEISEMHPTVQVSLLTFLANGTEELAGGFGLHTSNFSIVLTDDDVPGITYVCVNHVGQGMKGGIVVAASTVAIAELSPEVEFTFGPNPVVNNQFGYTINTSESTVFNIYSVTGKLEKTIEITSNEGIINLDLIPGNYILQVATRNGEAIETVRLSVK